jgi:flagellar export protein FliJ
MKKLEKLKSAGEIIEKQERQILAELRAIQLERMQIDNKILELESFSSQAKSSSIDKLVNSNHLATSVSFYHKLEQGITQLRASSVELSKNYEAVKERYKEISTTRLSINRLVDKYQNAENQRIESLEQQQIEEYVNYKYHF